MRGFLINNFHGSGVNARSCVFKQSQFFLFLYTLISDPTRHTCPSGATPEISWLTFKKKGL
jgi:hypothetical protein